MERMLNKSILDFIVMFLSNITKKVFGFVRELIFASIFGSSIIFSNFLLLKSVSDLLYQLTQGSALQANLLPKFSKLYSINKEMSLSEVLNFSKGFIWKLFIVSQIVHLAIIWYIDPDNLLLFILLSILLGIVVSFTFFSSIFLTIMQGKGEFQRSAISTTVDMLVSTFVLYPLSIFFSVLGIVISRLIGLFTFMYIYIKPMIKEVKGPNISLEIKDFSISIMILGNFANIIMIFSRFVAGSDGGNNISFYYYSVVLLNILLTSVILNFNTLVLRRLSIKKDVKLIFYSVFFSFLLGIGLVYVVESFGLDIIRIIFERGEFTSNDSNMTYLYAKDLSWSFVLLFISCSLFQPYFTLDHVIIGKESKFMAGLFIVAAISLCIMFLFLPTSSRDNSLIMIYGLSGLSVLMSIFSCIRYMQNINKS